MQLTCRGVPTLSSPLHVHTSPIDATKADRTNPPGCLPCCAMPLCNAVPVPACACWLPAAVPWRAGCRLCCFQKRREDGGRNQGHEPSRHPGVPRTRWVCVCGFFLKKRGVLPAQCSVFGGLGDRWGPGRPEAWLLGAWPAVTVTRSGSLAGCGTVSGSGQLCPKAAGRSACKVHVPLPACLRGCVWSSMTE